MCIVERPTYTETELINIIPLLDVPELEILHDIIKEEMKFYSFPVYMNLIKGIWRREFFLKHKNI